MVTSADSVDGEGHRHVGIAQFPDEVKTLITILKGEIFLLGKDWDSLLEPEKKEVCRSAVKTVSELNDLVRGKPEPPTNLLPVG